MKDPQWWPTGSITIYTHHFTEAERAQFVDGLPAYLARFTRWQRFKGWLADRWAKLW